MFKYNPYRRVNKGGHTQELEIKDEVWKLDPSTRIQEIKKLIKKK